MPVIQKYVLSLSTKDWQHLMLVCGYFSSKTFSRQVYWQQMFG